MTKNAKELKDGLRSASSSNLDLSSVLMNNTLQTYPSPLASYEQVVSDKNLFMSTLEKFHSEMGTEFSIPSVRTRDLDLHKLFVEVTSRGGIEQVLREAKWKDVIDTIIIPKSCRIPIISNRTRRNYYSLLHDYEIVYFSKSRDQNWIGFVSAKNEDGYLVTLTMGSWKLEGVLDESIEKKVAKHPQRRSLTDKANLQEIFKTKNIQWNKANKLQKKENTGADASMEDSEGVKVPVTVVLDGRFENGYLVTVTIGSENLRGVVYPQSPPLNTVTQKKLHEDEKTVHKEKAVVEDKERCSRGKEDHNCSDDLKTIAQLITEAKSRRQFSSNLRNK